MVKVTILKFKTNFSTMISGLFLILSFQVIGQINIYWIFELLIWIVVWSLYFKLIERGVNKWLKKLKVKLIM